MAIAAAEDELGRVLEHHLDDFVAVAHQDGLGRLLPLLDVGKRGFVLWPNWRLLDFEVEGQRLELRVSVQVALEVLKEDYLLVDGGGVLEEVVVGDQLRGGGLLVLGLASLDVVEVEQVGVGDQFSRIIEEHSVRPVSQLVAQTVLGGEVHKTLNKVALLLSLHRLEEVVMLELGSTGVVNLGEFSGVDDSRLFSSGVLFSRITGVNDSRAPALNSINSLGCVGLGQQLSQGSDLAILASHRVSSVDLFSGTDGGPEGVSTSASTVLTSLIVLVEIVTN